MTEFGENVSCSYISGHSTAFLEEGRSESLSHRVQKPFLKSPVEVESEPPVFIVHPKRTRYIEKDKCQNNYMYPT